jgi:hypothetical protein
MTIPSRSAAPSAKAVRPTSGRGILRFRRPPSIFLRLARQFPEYVVPQFRS